MAGINSLNSVQLRAPNRNVFDMSYDHKTTLNMGELIPIHWQEVLPSDNYKMSSEQMLRMMPMVAPVMHKVDVSVHHFFVPYRILFDKFDDFLGGMSNPGGIFPALPTIASSEGPITIERGSLGDYMGLPLGTITDPLQALPLAAYQMIWWEYYRDQNLVQQELGMDFENWIQLQEGQQDPTTTGRLLSLHRRAWEKDYFTAQLPFAQKGDSVGIPISGIIPVEYDPTGVGIKLGNWERQDLPGTPITNQTSMQTNSLGVTYFTPGNIVGNYNPQDTLYVDLANATGIETTINDFRTAYAMQRWFELAALGGTRLKELIYTHFAIVSPDARLDRPEYLGGSKTAMVISEVLQTSETSDESPLAGMAGHGISVGGGRDFNYFVKEHGIVISLMSVMPKPAYQQGIAKAWSRLDPLDFFWPTFQHLGEQEVKSKELYYYSGDDELNNETFGYLPKYEEYRHNLPRVSGDFRTSLDFWHLGRIFEERPYLNSQFIECTPSKRIFAVEDEAEHSIVAHIYHKIRVSRPIAKFGTPGLNV